MPGLTGRGSSGALSRLGPTRVFTDRVPKGLRTVRVICGSSIVQRLWAAVLSWFYAPVVSAARTVLLSVRRVLMLPVLRSRILNKMLGSCNEYLTVLCTL